MDVGQFYNGQYQCVLDSLLEVNQSGQYCSVTEQLVLKNNIAVCRHFLDQCVEKRKVQRLELLDVLKKCRSVPADEDVLSVEMNVLYNYTYITLHTSADHTTEVTDVYNQAYKTFSRVYRVLYQKKKVDVLQYKTIHAASYKLLTDIIEKLQFGYGNGKLLLGIYKCVLILAVLEIKSCNHTEALKMLEKLNCVLRHTEIRSQKEKVLSCPLQLDHSQLRLAENTDIQDVVTLLMGICMYKDQVWDKARDSLEQVQGQQVKNLAQFYHGYSLYKIGRYTESVSSLLELIRLANSLTQRLKARIYNLIGNCFMKLKKHQLAVQMFKEALCVDFSYLVPLYNTSLQYRNQGLDDLELECLNLLVTALDMKEVSTPSYYDSMDLVCLLDMDDEDVPYMKALYTFANRSLQLKRYNVSAEKYMCILEMLKTTNTHTQNLDGMPSLLQVHHEAIESLLMCKKYKDCISLCDKVLVCYHSNKSGVNESLLLSQTFDLTPNQSFCDSSISTSQCASGKRKFDDIIKSQDDQRSGDQDIIALKFKAMALHKMGDNSASLVCLERAIDSITQYRKLQLSKKMKADNSVTCCEPRKKRQKLDQPGIASMSSEQLDQSSIASMSREQLDQSSAEPHNTVARDSQPSSQDYQSKSSVIKGLLSDSGRMIDIEQELYTMTAEILESMKQSKDAKHFKQLAKQITLIKRE